MFPQDLYMNMYSSFIYNSPNLGAAKCLSKLTR